MSDLPEVWRYALVPRGALNARHPGTPLAGVLLRRRGGYACLQPWPELGDEPLDAQLRALRRGKVTALVARALANTEEDAAARLAGNSLFAGLRIPPSHATVTGLIDAGVAAGWAERGFGTLKLKLGPDWRHGHDGLLAAAAAYPLLRWRIDFNASLDAAEFLRWAEALPDSLRARIDFVEDPYPFDAADWTSIEKESGLRLAADAWCADPAAVGFIGICKPARDDAAQLLDSALGHSRPMVVTSNMDHSLGVLHAAMWAGRYAAAGVHCGPAGLCTHLLFAEDDFAAGLGPDGDRLRAPTGAGLGCGSLLDKLPWTPLDRSVGND